MNPKTTAVILIGYQNDYFLSDGILHQALESTAAATTVLNNTVHLIEQLRDSPVLFINTPIIFTADYSELTEPVGILKTIKEVEAFKKDTRGSETVAELKKFGDRIIEIPGKRGLNAFSNTSLHKLLIEHEITEVILAGAVTSICIDTTGRTAFDHGFQVSILEDCCAGRSEFEQGFYCKEIFPLYANVVSSDEFLNALQPE